MVISNSNDYATSNTKTDIIQVIISRIEIYTLIITI